MFDNRNLEALAAVVEEGGFDKAAKRLHVTQSAVSQRIRGLEEELGQVLVVRSTPPAPTEAGRELIRHLRKVRLLEHELAEAIEPGQTRGFTTLPVGVNADSLATWFLDALEDFVRENRILLDLCVDDEHRTHELLRRGEVVGCVGTGDDIPRGCRSDHLGTIDYLCVCTPGFQEVWFRDGFTEEAAAEAPAAIFNRKDETQARMMAQLFKSPGATRNNFYTPSSEAIIEVILRGLAYGMLPDLQAGPHLDSGRLVELFPEARVPVPLYWRSWNMDTPLLTGLRRALMGYFEGRGK